MKNIMVELGERSYEISIGQGIISRLIDFITVTSPLKGRNYTKIAIVTNETLNSIYNDLLKRLSQELRARVFVIPDGEQYKDILWFYYLQGRLLENRFDRSSLLIAFGGGVIGDLTGFVASTFMRGIDYVQIPTTLLAQVDSSVGGKTAVNHPLGKNMIGTFHQPVFVLIDTEFLKTLPKREFLAGMAEVIKYGIIWDQAFFHYLREHHRDILALEPEALIQIISRSCAIKAEVVSRDEKESGLRSILNYGHTIGHAIETITGYTRFLHGEAVAMGMYAEAITGVSMGLSDREIPATIRDILEAFQMNPYIPSELNPEDLVSTMLIDKKSRGGRLRCVIPSAIGKVSLQEVPPEEFSKAISLAKGS